MFLKSVDKLHLVNMEKVLYLSIRQKFEGGMNPDNYELAAYFEQGYARGGDQPVVLAEGDADTLNELLTFIENKFATVDLAKIYKSILNTKKNN